MKDFYWQPTPTRAQTPPLFWPPKSRSRKRRQRYNQNGQRLRNKKTQQPNKSDKNISRKWAPHKSRSSWRIQDVHDLKAPTLQHKGDSRDLWLLQNSEKEHTTLQKVAEESKLKPGGIIYIVIISQKKSSYGYFKNWVLIQDCDTKQKLFFSLRQKNIYLEKLPLYWRK